MAATSSAQFSPSQTTQLSPQKPSTSDNTEHSVSTGLNNGKVVFKQKTMSFERHLDTLQGIVNFRDVLGEHIAKQLAPLDTVPEQFNHLIAKLGHESDKSLALLTKHIHKELLSSFDDDDDSVVAGNALPLSAVETTIKSILTRINYGLDAVPGRKHPAAACVWRWEVIDDSLQGLPEKAKEKAQARRQERVAAKKELSSLFDALSEAERDAFLPLDKSVRALENATASTSATDDSVLTDKDAEKPKATGIENDAPPIKGKGKQKKVTEPKATRVDKKVAKGEKDKKAQENDDKPKGIAKYFNKAPAVASSSSAKPKPTVIAEPVQTQSTSQSDFARTFKPFVVKKDTVVAPVNWFINKKQRPEVIVIDGESDVEMADVELVSINVGGMSEKDRLSSILSGLPPGFNQRVTKPLGKKLPNWRPLRHHAAPTVRQLLTNLSEAEVAGDDALVRDISSKLSDRAMFPLKVFIYHEDARPGYFGTWTRQSRVIGPRTPFGKDVVQMEYGYDSGEEWEGEDEPSTDVDDVVDDDDEDGDSEDRDSDFDDWLDDSEEGAVPPETRGTSPSLPLPSTKRKAEEVDTLSKKRKVVVPLVPYAKGPCWESNIGECENIFQPYQLRLFNDCPLPLDPFTFVSTWEPTSTGTKPVKFAVPALPQRVTAVSDAGPPGAVATATASNLNAPPKKPIGPPKTAFPDAHLPYLLTTITDLKAPGLNFLVDSVFQELKVHKVKKNAIEAKIREIAEKCKSTRVWIVKDDTTPQPTAV